MSKIFDIMLNIFYIVRQDQLRGIAMGSQERNVYVALISTLLVYATYCALVLFLYGKDFFYSGDPSLAGKSILLLMIACAASNFLLRQAVVVFVAVSLKSYEKAVADERDKMIELNGMQASYAVFAIGFVAAMSMLWTGWPAVLALHVITLTLILGEIISGIIKVIQYRRDY